MMRLPECFKFNVVRLLAIALFVMGASPVRSPSDLLKQAKQYEADKRYDDAISAYREFLTMRPENDEVRASLARLLSWAEDFEEAARLYRDILTRYPTDLEIRTALARVLSWQKKFTESRALYEEVLREDPNNIEALRGLADTLVWTGEQQKAVPVYQALYERTQDPEVAGKIDRIRANFTPSLPYRDYLKFGYSHFTYSRRSPNEREWQIEAAKPLGDQTLIGRVQVINRFGKLDVPVSADLYSPLWSKAWSYVSLGGGIEADFSPKIYVASELYQGIGALHPALSFLEPSIGFRWMSFSGAKVEVLIPGLTIYLPSDVWLTERAYYVPDANTVTVSSQLNWQIHDRLRVFFAAAFGRTADRFETIQDFQSTSSQIFRLGGTFPITSRVSGEAWGYYEQRKDLYARRGASFQLIYHW
jgi:YaiO family outer membrane protein